MRRAFLDDAAEVHDQNAVGYLANQREVVGDQQVGDARRLLNVAHQVDDLGLDRHVERGHRLVGDDHLGVECEGARDGDPLALAAGELRGVAVGSLRWQAHLLKQLRHARAASVAVTEVVGAQRLGKNRADAHARVETGVRVLKDHLQASPYRLQPGCRKVSDLLAGEADGAAVGADGAHQRQRQRRLAGPGFADEAHGLTGGDGKRNAVEGVHAAFGRAECDAHVAGIQQRRVAHAIAPAVTGSRSGCQQRAMWSGATAARAGRTSQAVSARAQRGAKGQPVRASPGRGG